MRQSRREINSSIAKRVMGKGRRVIVQDCESFMKIARSLTVSTKVVHIDGETINNFNDADLFQNTLPVNGILKMPVSCLWMATKWRNFGEICFIKKTADPDTWSHPCQGLPQSQLAKRVHQIALLLQLMTNWSSLTCVEWQRLTEWLLHMITWVFLGTVIEVINQKAKVHCLQNPFGAQGPKKLEKESHAVYFDKLYHMDITPNVTQVEETSKKGCKMYWIYWSQTCIYYLRSYFGSKKFLAKHCAFSSILICQEVIPK